MPIPDSFKTRKNLTVAGRTFGYFSVPALEQAGFSQIARLP